MSKSIYNRDVITRNGVDLSKHGKRDALLKQFNAGELRHPYTGALTSRVSIDKEYTYPFIINFLDFHDEWRMP